MANGLTEEAFVEYLYENGYDNNCAEFTVDFTNLFTELDGTINDPYRKQVEFMNFLTPMDRVVVVLKARQCGISTAIVAYAFWCAMFAKYPEIVIISAGEKQAMKVMARIKQCFNDLHESVRPKLVTDSKLEIGLQSGVRLYSLASNPKTMRGYTGVVLWDEASVPTADEQERIFSAIYPTITKGGKLIMVSTPLGTSGKFYDLCTEDIQNHSGNDVVEIKTKIKKMFIYYTDVPHLVDAVENKGLFDAMDKSSIEQEYMLQFKDMDEEEQYFTKDFLMINHIDKNITDEFYTSFKSLGIPSEYLKTKENLKRDLPEGIELEYLDEEYEDIRGGWDIATTENDSILSINGKRKDTDIRVKIGEFKLNRMASFLHETSLQIHVAKKVCQVMKVKRLTIDSTGMGDSVFSNIKDNHRGFSSIVVGLNYNKDKEEKLTQFALMKKAMTDGKYVRPWNGSRQDYDCIRQYTNLRMYKLQNSLKAKGRDKDDIPNADMLSLYEKMNVNSSVWYPNKGNAKVIGEKKKKNPNFSQPPQGVVLPNRGNKLGAKLLGRY